MHNYTKQMVNPQ